MSEPQRPKITADTNCVIRLFDSRSTTATSVDELCELMSYALSGVIEISVTTRVEADLVRDTDAQRRMEMLDKIRMFPVIGTVVRRGDSQPEGTAALVEPEHRELFDEVQRIVFPGLHPQRKRYPNEVSDIDHLVGHKLAERTVFVTDDKRILRRSDRLQSGPGIQVMSPAECLKYVDEYRARHEKKVLEPVHNDSAYRDSRLKGTATFDYSNNDHCFSIGDGLNLFETQWSKASDVSIYAYSDPPSIAAVALAKGATEIADVTDAAAFDFSSRVRSPRVGQIVIWRNVNGIYAATKETSAKRLAWEFEF